MNDELEQNKIPKTYDDLVEKYQVVSDCISSIPDGWVPLVDEMFSKMKAAGWKGDLGQIKSKFSRLCVYLSDTSHITYNDDQTNEFHSHIKEACNKSIAICTSCGYELIYEQYTTTNVVPMQYGTCSNYNCSFVHYR